MINKHLFLTFLLYLHGARDLRTLEERSPQEIAKEHNWRLVPEYSSQFSSIEDVIQAAKKLDPAKTEGFVVVDAHFNRVKIKSPSYGDQRHLTAQICDHGIDELEGQRWVE